jgi:hypothetical protein
VVKEYNRDAISTSVIVRRRMKRLMEVADEMDYISQSIGSRLSTGAAIAKHS